MSDHPILQTSFLLESTGKTAHPPEYLKFLEFLARAASNTKVITGSAEGPVDSHAMMLFPPQVLRIVKIICLCLLTCRDPLVIKKLI